MKKGTFWRRFFILLAIWLFLTMFFMLALWQFAEAPSWSLLVAFGACVLAFPLLVLLVEFFHRHKERKEKDGEDH